MTKKIIFSSIVTALLVLMPQSDSYALALSEIKINSSLNQPLNATIELFSATPAELDSLNTLISRSKSESTGSGGQGHWPKLKVELVRMEKGNSYLKITSKENMREPILKFLLELGWSTGRIQREYSLLLNPPH
jgi:pilus assembly protein FimV